MAEVLTIKKLGPLKEARIEPRPLTVIIGPQASGKSLIAQCLYFFRGIQQHVAHKYKLSWLEDNYWYNTALKEVLDDIRGVPFGYFANGTASLFYSDSGIKSNQIGLTVHCSNRQIKASTNLKNIMNTWLKTWSDDPRSLEKNWEDKPNLYIPTERSIFTWLVEKNISMLFDLAQTEPFRAFAKELLTAQQMYVALFQRSFYNKKIPAELKSDINYVLLCQRRALAGEAYVPPRGRKEWKWRVLDPADDSDLSYNNRVLPIKATASGQTEAWPFFVIAATYGMLYRGGLFYFEEPETHLHPSAQLEIANVIALLVNRGQQFTITTHSPFFLYVINNYIMRHMASGKKFDNGKVALDPNDVAVYSIKKDGTCRDIMDREDTKLIPSTELDDIANQLGAEFDQLLDQLDRD